MGRRYLELSGKELALGDGELWWCAKFPMLWKKDHGGWYLTEQFFSLSKEILNHCWELQGFKFFTLFGSQFPLNFFLLLELNASLNGLFRRAHVKDIVEVSWYSVNMIGMILFQISQKCFHYQYWEIMLPPFFWIRIMIIHRTLPSEIVSTSIIILDAYNNLKIEVE